MKSVLKTIAVSLVLLFSVSATFAQSTTYINYSMSGDGQMGQMLNGSTIELYFNKDNFKMEMDMMGGMVAMDIRMDLQKGNGIMMMDMMGQQQYRIIDEDDQQQEQATGKMPEIKYLDQYKTIAGYKCQKALIQPEGEDVPVVVYFTKDMEIPSYLQDYINKMKMEGLKGLPLEFEVNDPESGKLVVKATEVTSKRYPKSIFSIKAPDGYTEMDENGAKMIPGMMGN